MSTTTSARRASRCSARTAQAPSPRGRRTSGSSRRRSSARAGSARQPLRHAHLPDRPRADTARARQLDDRRHRRRPVVGSGFIDVLAKFEADEETEIVVMVGEIGGAEEEKAAEYIKAEMTKPVVAYIAGFTAPRVRRWATPARSSPAPPTAQAKKEASRPAASGSARRRPRSHSSPPTPSAHAPEPRFRRHPTSVLTSTHGHDLTRPRGSRRRNVPVAELAECAGAAVQADGATILSFTVGGGYAPLRRWIADEHGLPEPRRPHERIAQLSRLARVLAGGGERSWSRLPPMTGRSGTSSARSAPRLRPCGATKAGSTPTRSTRTCAGAGVRRSST